MALEDPRLLKEKNQKRLRDVKNTMFALGINVTPPSKAKKYLRIITIILIIASWVDIYGHVCYIARYKNSIFLMTESVITMLQVLISIFKLSYILFVQHRFHNILRMIESHELIDKIEFLSQETSYNRKLRIDAQTILENCWRNAKAQFNFFMISCLLLMVYYICDPQTSNAYNWYMGNTNYTNVLPLATLFPFCEHRMNELPCYATLTLVVSTASFVADIGAISFDGTFIIIALHGVGLIRILRRMIVFTTSPRLPKRLHLVYLRQCIEHYNRTSQFCKDFNDLYLHISLVQFLLSLVILGVVMFQASVGWGNDTMTFLKMIMYMLAAGYEVIIYCLNGQLIFNECDALSNAWYECEWYNESREFKQLIQMMIMRSNQVSYMKVSWFSTMSLTTMVALIKTSVSYFLLLQNLSASGDL